MADALLRSAFPIVSTIPLRDMAERTVPSLHRPLFHAVGRVCRSGVPPVEELPTYGADAGWNVHARYHARVEMIGGSLVTVSDSVGQALGLRIDGSGARVFVELSDGEMQEGSTWEAAMSAGHFGLDNLVALIDCNGIQADGPVVLDMEPVAGKWAAFGWSTQEIDGNDMEAVVAALKAARTRGGKPHAIVMRTLPGKGVRRIETSEKSHFFRVDVGQWDGIIAEFEKSLEPAA